MTSTAPPTAPPTASPSEIAQIARDLGLPSAAADADQFAALVGGMAGGDELLDSAGVEDPDRGPVEHHRPDRAEDPGNAWFLRCALRGREGGPLAGRRLAVKDNIMVAGLPLSAGSRLLEGYRASFDATVVARALAAGATVVGKTNCEYLCLDGNSYTSDYGIVHHPRRHGYSAGGSSSGNAVALATGQADLALGTDQAGSIRVPASFCGVVGLKPTHGLVPYTGALGLDPVIDHAGPMATTVADTAALLTVLAGDDGYDPRQRGVRGEDYLAGLDADPRGLRVGVLAEGFGRADSDPEVDAAVRAAAERLAGLGARVDEVSVPDHVHGLACWTPLVLHGMAGTVVHGQGFGLGRAERYPVDLMEHLLARRDRADEMPATVVACALAAEYLRRRDGGTRYARAVNALRRLRARYDAALRDVDVLLMPTTPHRARPLPAAGTPVGEYVARANEMFGNTAVFNGTGHPALSLPCGEADGLPVGMMLVGRAFDERTVLRVGHAYERHAGWAGPSGGGATAAGSPARGESRGPRPVEPCG